LFTGNYRTAHGIVGVPGDAGKSVLGVLANPPATAVTAETHGVAAQTALGKAGAVKPVR
jgi:hypothetical protein